jgi:endonuclease/exonuclease/phosphatase family metal-dependent hydrolase
MKCHILTYNIHGLPWCKTDNQEIIQWIQSRKFPIVCFQELFTAKGKQLYSEKLSDAEYEVLFPMDEGVTLFPSGLCVCIQRPVYRVLDTFFRPFLTYNYSDRFANKGFFGIHLENRETGKRMYIVNTHVQSDWELTHLFGNSDTYKIRRNQAEQIVEFCEELRDPVLVVGDLNQETSLHAYLRFLHPITDLPLKKATFFQTGEDLDHICWLPLQYAKRGCGYCDIRRRGPQLLECVVHPHSWSDHAAVESRVFIPDISSEHES